MAATGYVPPPTRGGRDGERLTAMQVAVREATNAARKASKTITWTAIEWRKTNAPAWRGGAAGEQDGDDDDDVDDDDGDDRSQPVLEEEPTDDEGGGEEWETVAWVGRGLEAAATHTRQGSQAPPRGPPARGATRAGAHPAADRGTPSLRSGWSSLEADERRRATRERT